MNLEDFPSPCFILNEDRLSANLLQLRTLAQAHSLRILLALKGFAYWRIFPLLSKYLQGASASSLHEARLAYEEMGYKVHMYSPAYVPSQFLELLPYVERISFNSLSEWDRYAAIAKAKGISCGLRVQPGYGSSPNLLYDPTARGSRFGVSEDKMDNIPKDVEGLHIHALCEANSYELDKLLTAVETRWGRFFSKLRWLNLGGGHLFTDKDYDLHYFANCVSVLQLRYPRLQLVFEPSSAVAWQSGVLKTTVLDIVKQEDLRTAILDISFTCHTPDCLEMPYRPLVKGASLDGSLPYRYRLGGISCLSGDFLESYSFEKPLSIGDTLVFEDMMHYTMVKTTTFNGISHPSIGVWQKDRGASLLRTFSYRDYKTRLS